MSGIWKTKDGKEIKISDMSDSHLRNTIRMIETKLDKYQEPQYYPDVYFELKSELEKREINNVR